VKALKTNPWNEAAKKYKKDDVVTGVIIKYNKHGALSPRSRKASPDLVHISEFGSEDKLRQTLLNSERVIQLQDHSLRSERTENGALIHRRSGEEIIN
jgi:ribosomal protein S1